VARNVDNGGRGSKIGLALAGGGPEGAVYEIGALRALDEVLEGLDLNDVNIYVGVSAGSFVAACLANRLSTAQLCRATFKSDGGENPFVPETFFTPAFKEFGRCGLMTPRLAFEALWDFAANPQDMSLVESFMRLSRALPVGLFDNEPIRKYLERIFALKDRTDDFRKLKNKLIVVASDLDTGQAVCFGEAGNDDVPISRAVQASTALPGLYPPVQIDNRHYVDGVLLKTLHASVALEHGAELLICLNPIVPVDTTDSVAAGIMKRGKLVNRGLPTVLAQTFRTMVHSRLTVGMASYKPRFPDVDVVLLEPGRDDYRMFFTNIFSFSSRRAICEHAYHTTRQQLRERRAELEPIFERHGIRVRGDILAEKDRDLWHAVGIPQPASMRTAAGQLDRALDRLEALLEEQNPA
jgi:predicted acylesterase/phospholipase RssA